MRYSPIDVLSDGLATILVVPDTIHLDYEDLRLTETCTSSPSSSSYVSGSYISIDSFCRTSCTILASKSTKVGALLVFCTATRVEKKAESPCSFHNVISTHKSFLSAKLLAEWSSIQIKVVRAGSKVRYGLRSTSMTTVIGSIERITYGLASISGNL